jgi:hypothetical protein
MSRAKKAQVKEKKKERHEMSKKEKTMKQPKVGDPITEPLSAEEISQRAEEAKKDADTTLGSNIPAAPKPSKIFKKKETKEETEAAAQVETNEADALKAEYDQILAVQPLAEKHALIASQNGHTGQSSNLKMISESIKQMSKRNDYLTPRARK